jgi:uroporphyrinogen decarboxylase
VQGNLDPVLLFAEWNQLKSRAQNILEKAAGRPGHIFNLGHGILPETPVEHVKDLAHFVQEYSATSGSRSNPAVSRKPKDGGRTS